MKNINFRHIRFIYVILTLFVSPYNSFSQDLDLVPESPELQKKESIQFKILEMERKIFAAPKELNWRFFKIRMLFDLEEFSFAKEEILNLLETSKSNKYKWFLNNTRINKSSSKKIIIDSLLSFRQDFFADYHNDRKISNIKIIMNEAYEVYPDIENPEFFRMLSLSCPWQKKEDVLLKAYKLDSKNIKVLHELAEYYFIVENDDKALEFFKACKQNSTEKFLLTTFEGRIDEIIKRKNEKNR